ncbi:hypothetical protein CIHG_05515 [Coccidioides immitis H538.4]|uniref:Superkiller protein 3 n=1 Tax=Coccidioides immitis H538.4 TaxID=396776 RepID=A0A0J8RT54_COCIT|nr:hypothetical protein CIHG_05515 [Coccidioides immitis H538.4]
MPAKSALRNIRACLDAGDFAQAAIKATELCEQDPQNYHAHVFLGLALDKLNDADASERAYINATKLKADDKTAWQGLINLYERLGGKKLDDYASAVIRLCHIFGEADEKSRAQALVEKYISSAGKSGTTSQYKQALKLLLPLSPLFNVLEGLIPHPSHTYLRVIELSEAEEKQFINREIGERRTRLGAKIDQVTAEVKLEAFRRSDLDELYRGLIDWTHDDAVRREHEEKLLQRGYDYLLALPIGKKPEQRNHVIKSANDMVIIHHPFDRAWKIALEWKDVNELSELDVTLLREYIQLFPDDGLSKVLKGWLASDLSPFPKETDPETQVDQDVSKAGDPADDENQVPGDDPLLLMAEGLVESSGSVLSHRIMGEVYLALEEFQSTTEVSRKGLALALDLQRRTGLKLRNTIDSMNTALATALITYQSPKNHPEAKQIFEEILKRNQTSTKCLLGLGLIFEEDQGYDQAVALLEKALQRDPKNARVRCELFWCRAHCGELQQATRGLEETLTMIQCEQSQYRDLKAVILYRIGQCQWELDPSPTARKDRNGAYAKFLGSIQSNMNYAPAYTSLGIFYADYKKDQKRAKRCFHKAIELSSSETEAAERLARDFANQGDWDLVEAIAQRVVDSGKAKPAPGSRRKGHSWPYAALGVVEINRQQYTKSIVSFQTALRISPNDYHCWVGLGESYHNSGRYISAIKSFQHAQALEETLSEADRDHIWFARYMMANVMRELGDFPEAISRYKEVLNMKPDEFGISIALLQTLTESSWKSVESGVFSDAAEMAATTIRMGISIAKRHPNSVNLWKAIGDAFSTFSWIENKTALMPVSEFKALLDTRSRGRMYTRLGRWVSQSLMRCFKRAIDSRPEILSLERTWYACASLSPKVAQHSFVRSLHINERSASVWTNLGALYLLNNDFQLANEAFTKAQSADPDLSHAWLGQAILAFLIGDVAEARELVTHAFTLGNSSLVFPKRQYTTSVFDHLCSSSASSDLSHLIQPLFALHQLHTQEPSNLPHDHLSALLAERLGDTAGAKSSLERVCSAVETEYEATESISALSRYSQAKADMARAQLAHLEYETAVESAETALSLSNEDGVAEFDTETHKKLRLSAHLTAGLAYYYLKEMDRAIDMFRDALQEANSSPDVICLLAQVLWAKGGEEERSVAREQLFNCVEQHPDHVGAVTLLGVIALLDMDEDAIDAVESDLQSMRTNNELSIHDRTKVSKLLAGVSSITSKNEPNVSEEQSRIHQASISVMLSPSEPQGWKALALASSEEFPAQMTVLTALGNIPPHGSLGAVDVSRACALTGQRQDALKAVMVAPWISDGWEELSHCLIEA